MCIYSGIIGFELSEQIVSSGTITFQTGCEFNISSPQPFFFNISVKRATAGTFLWTGKSDVSAVSKSSGSNLYVRVIPVEGIWSADGTNRVGQTSREGLG